MHKRRRITCMLVLGLLFMTGCSDEKELQPAKNNNIVKHTEKLNKDLQVVDNYKKAFGDLKYGELPNLRGIINVDNTREILGDEYNTYITAFSLESDNIKNLRNIVLAQHSIHMEDRFQENDLNLKAIYNLLHTQKTTAFKDLNFKEFVEYLNKVIKSENNKFIISSDENEYINITRNNSKVVLTVCNIDIVENTAKKYVMKNYSYNNFLELMYNSNSHLLNTIAAELELKVQQPDAVSVDRSVVGYVPSFRLPNGEVLDIGIQDGQSAENMRRFDIDFVIKLEGNLAKRLKPVLEISSDFLYNKFGLDLDYSTIMNDAKTTEILDNFIREYEEINELKPRLNPKGDNRLIEYNPYAVDAFTVMSNNSFELKMKIPIKVDNRRTK